MKILVITPIFPPDIGGPASYVPAVSASLVEKGHAVTVLTLSDVLTHDDSGYLFPVIRILRPAARVMRDAANHCTHYPAGKSRRCSVC